MPASTKPQVAPSPPDVRQGPPTRDLGSEKIPYDILKLIPQESAQLYKLVPIGMEDGALEIGMLDPEDIGAYDALNFITKSTGMPFKVFGISRADLDRVLDMYKGLGGDVDRAVTDLETEQKADIPSSIDSEAF